ncbi:MAG: CHASE2 domain-containing protein [Candidatus Scalindua sp.]|nr:CHASE2 domain-containing protein [Candidatus Scalindua sp.]
MFNVKSFIKKNFYGFLWGLAVAAIISSLYFTGIFDKPEKILYDWRLRNNTIKKSINVPKIAIIGITDEDMQLFGHLPWPRSRYAELVNYLKKGGASVIAFDMFFDLQDSENPENDTTLSEAAVNAEMIIFPVWSPTVNLFRTRPTNGIYKGKIIENIPLISVAAKRTGHLNVFYDSDGVARRVPLQISSADGRKHFIPLSLAAFLESKGIEEEIELYHGNLLRIGNLTIPIDKNSCLPINYIDFEKYINLYQQNTAKWLDKIGTEKPITLYSFSDVSLQNENMPPSDHFKDKIVLFGITSPGAEQDVHVTPFERKFGIFLHANILYNLLTENFIWIPQTHTFMFIIVGVSIFLSMLIFRMRLRGSTYALLAGGILFLFLLSGIVALTSLLLFQKANIMLEMMPFITMLLMNTGACLAVNLSAANKESAMRELELNILLEVGEITTCTKDSHEYSLQRFQDDVKITSAFTVSSTLPSGFLEPIKKITHCEVIALYTLDVETKCFNHSVSIGLHEKKEELHRIANIANEWILSDEKPVWIDNVSIHPDFSLLQTNIRNFFCVPIFLRRKIIGTLFLCNKPSLIFSPLSKFTPEELRFLSSFTHQIAIAIENHQLNISIHTIFLDYIKSISAALDARDSYTHGHSKRVAKYSIGIGRELGLTAGELEFIKLSSTIHDIGKIGISSDILNKPGRLSDKEFEIIKSHTYKGSKILEPMSRLSVLMPGVRNHHERYDGKGYPDGLKGNEIHLIARIISIADAYDAMTSDRVYRKGLPMKIACQEIEKGAGTQFDPKLATMFLTFIHKYTENKRMKTDEISEAAILINA